GQLELMFCFLESPRALVSLAQEMMGNVVVGVHSYRSLQVHSRLGIILFFEMNLAQENIGPGRGAIEQERAFQQCLAYIGPRHSKLGTGEPVIRACVARVEPDFLLKFVHGSW